MEDIKEKAADLVDHIEDLGQTFYRLSLIKVTEKATNAVSTTIVVIAFCILGVFALLFLGIALSWWIGNLVGSRPLGFVIGAGGYLLLLLIVVLIRKAIVFPIIRDSIISKVYDTPNN